MSLSQLYKNYENRKKNSEKATQIIKKQIERCIEDQTISALKLQNHKVNNIHKNQQIIETKLKKQQELLSQFRNNQDMWKSLYEQLNRTLMEAGDLVHYAGYVQAEIAQLLGEGTVAQYLQEAQKEGGAQQTQIHQNQMSLSKQDPKIKTQTSNKEVIPVSLVKQTKAQEDYKYIA